MIKKEPKPFAFIRKSDGAIFIKHPTKKHWVLKDLFEKHNQEGWPYWTTDLFKSYAADGVFEVLFSKYGVELTSNYYRCQKEWEELKIKKWEFDNNECYYCHMPKHVCLCSHDDEDD
jgi:hypothetical protein